MASFDLVIIGAGITGLCIAHGLSDIGLSIAIVEANGTLVSTSAQSAGMIAPAVEALSYGDPYGAFTRLKAASDYWYHQDFEWPQALKQALGAKIPTYWRINSDQKALDTLKAFGVIDDEIIQHNGSQWVRVKTDTALSPLIVLKALWDDCERRGAHIIKDRVHSLHGTSLILSDGQTISAGVVVLAGGYVNEALRADIPILKGLRPIKGHLLRFSSGLWEDDKAQNAIWRDPTGYGLSLGDFHCFGATMQLDQADWDCETDQIERLKQRAAAFGVSSQSLSSVTAQVGVRAGFDDCWPIIRPIEGRNLFLCAGLRRNGFVFAPQVAYNAKAWVKSLGLN